MPIIGYTPETNGYPYNMMLGDEHMRRESLDMIKLAMDMAKEMNAGYTLISAAHAGYLTPPNVIWGRLAENLSELCEYAENIGMDLILEPLTPYESNVVCNANDVLHALALVPYAAPVQHGRHLRAVCPGGTGDELFRQTGR